MMFFHHENPHEASNGFVKAVTPQRFSKFSNVKFSPLCVKIALLKKNVDSLHFHLLQEDSAGLDERPLHLRRRT